MSRLTKRMAEAAYEFATTPPPPKRKKKEGPTASYYAGVAGSAAGFEVGNLAYRQAFVSNKNSSGPKMPKLGTAKAFRSAKAGKYGAAAARMSRAGKTFSSGVGAKARRGLKFGLPATAAGLAGSIAMGAYMQSRTSEFERRRGMRSVTQPKEGNGATVGRLIGGIGGGLGAAAAVGGRLASRHWAIRIGGAALSSMGGSVGGDFAGAKIGGAFDKYKARTRRRVQKACFDVGDTSDVLSKADPRDGDKDGRIFDGTKNERAASGAKERLSQATKSFRNGVKGAAEFAANKAGKAKQVAGKTAKTVAQEARREVTFLGTAPIEGKAQLVVEKGLKLLARIESVVGITPPGMGYSMGGSLDEALELYANKAGLDARKLVRTVKDHRRMRAIVRSQIKAAKKLIGLVKDGWDEDTLALAWMAREGLASVGQILELQRRMR